MKKKVVLACLLMASVCGVYAQNVRLGSLPGMYEQYYDGFVYEKDAWGNDNLYLYDEARRFDWGVSSNIGIKIHHWYAKLQYDLSLGKEGKNDVIGANYHTLTLSVGYKFGL